MSHFTTDDGLRLHYTDEGKGPPLLCLAGLTRCGGDFSFVAPHLSGRRVLTMDYRGRGQSDHDPDIANYAIPREARDVIALLDYLELDRVQILGTSRGGLVAMVLAATCPERLSGVVLNDIGPEIAPAGLTRIMSYVGSAPRAQTLEAAAQALQADMADEFPGVPLTRWRAQTAILYEQTSQGLALRYDPRLRDALIAQAEAGPAPDLWPLFEALGPIPTGVIRGANSDLLSAETLARMHERHPGLKSAQVPDRGHVPFLDEPEALALIHEVLS